MSGASNVDRVDSESLHIYTSPPRQEPPICRGRNVQIGGFDAGRGAPTVFLATYAFGVRRRGVMIADYPLDDLHLSLSSLNSLFPPAGAELGGRVRAVVTVRPDSSRPQRNCPIGR